MDYEHAKAAAAFSVLEALVWTLLDNDQALKVQFQDEVERYAEMHELGQRQPNDKDVARYMRMLARIPPK